MRLRFPAREHPSLQKRVPSVLVSRRLKKKLLDALAEKKIASKAACKICFYKILDEKDPFRSASLLFIIVLALSIAMQFEL
jgi:hypothetical protein